MIIFQEGPRHSELIIPGYHAPEIEVNFAQKIIDSEIKPKYDGPLRLVGSRAAKDGPWWVSKTRFIELAKKFKLRIETQQLESWISIFNKIAQERQLCRKDIITLESEIRNITPNFKISSSSLDDLKKLTGGFFSGQIVVPGSDIDILLVKPTIDYPMPWIYHDSNTSQVIDLHLPNK